MLGLFGPIGLPELLLILALALIIFGPGKLPEVGKALGKGINEFKKASRDIQKDMHEAINEADREKNGMS